MPRVSVVMAVHNGIPFVQEAIQSILDQTLDDFEFIIVDDKSTDESLACIKDIRDQRIRLIANEEHLGLSTSLNTGIAMSEGDFVARMDHDDVSMRTRFAEQVSFLDAHPAIDILGTWAKTIGRQPEQTWRYPSLDADIRSEFVFNSSLVHSSVMWRRASFERHGLAYDPKVNRAQDYELWTRAQRTVRFGNLEKVLLRYRIHAGSVGAQFEAEQKKAADQVRERELEHIGVKATSAELDLHHAIARWEFPKEVVGLGGWDEWLLKLRESNQASGAYPVAAFDCALERRWWSACRANLQIGRDAWRTYSRSALHALGNRRVDEQAIFLGKAALQELRKPK